MDDKDSGGNPRLARMAPTWEGSFKASLRSKIQSFYQNKFTLNSMVSNFPRNEQ